MEQLHGLKQSEVTESREKYGSNVIPDSEPTTFWKEFRETFQDPMIRILVAIALLMIVMFFFGYAQIYEPLGTIVAILVVAFVTARTGVASDSKYRDLKNSVKKDIETQKDSLLSQMIAIVAIFVGISFVMFGGMSLINDLFTHIDGQPVPLVELICLGCLIGIVMIIVMYCFIMFILSVTRNRMLRAKKIFFRIVQKSCTILGLVSCIMFIIWCCQTFLK